MHTNMVSTVTLARAVLPSMLSRAWSGKGLGPRILITSSITGSAPQTMQAVYGATKAFVSSFGQALQFEVAGRGVGVTVSLPGATLTDFASASNSEKALCFAIPGYPATAQDVAREAVEAAVRGDSVVVHGA
jgi:short-subunit dehydrogenase